MIERRQQTIIALLVIVLLAAPALADPLMPGLSAQWIARDMTINGVPTSIRSVHGDLKPEDVLRYYRKEWAGRLDERVEGEWRVLATRHRDRFISLRLRSTSNSVQGILTDSLDPAKATPSLASPLPIPHGLETLSRHTFTDGGIQGENLTLASRRSVAFERQAFASTFRLDGWTRMEDRAAQTVSNGHILNFVRRKESVRIVLYRDPALLDGRTLILVTAYSQ